MTARMTVAQARAQGILPPPRTGSGGATHRRDTGESAGNAHAPPAGQRAFSGQWVSKRTLYDGVWYDSKGEASVAQILDAYQRSGAVVRWWGQVRVPLVLNGVRLTPRGYTRIDFFVEFPDRTEWWDYKPRNKGKRDQRWPLIRQLVMALHGIRVIEVRT